MAKINLRKVNSAGFGLLVMVSMIIVVILSVQQYYLSIQEIYKFNILQSFFFYAMAFLCLVLTYSVQKSSGLLLKAIGETTFRSAGMCMVVLCLCVL